MSTRRKSFIAVIASLGLVLGTALSGPAFANPNYPSAAEVAAAQANVTDKQNMIVRIENLIADLAVKALSLFMDEKSAEMMLG